MEVLQPIKNYINNFDTEMTDPRSWDVLIVYKPSVMFALIVIYLVLIKFILPAYMKNRPPYRLKKVILYYNIFQVVTNAYITYLCFWSGFVRRFSLMTCRDLDSSTTDNDALMAFKGIHYYTLLKFTEFFDTFFFILRKKENQVSFLHVYHHTSMVFNSWLALKFLPGGSTVIPGGLNASIHVVMYTYYLLAGLGPKWQKYIWWKKYLTTFQIIQFLIGIGLVFLTIFTPEYCPNFMKRKVLIIYGGLYTFSLLYLFAQFYKNSYHTKTTEKELNGDARKAKTN